MKHNWIRLLALVMALAMLPTSFALADVVPLEIEGEEPYEIVLEIEGAVEDDGIEMEIEIEDESLVVDDDELALDSATLDLAPDGLEPDGEKLADQEDLLEETDFLTDEPTMAGADGIAWMNWDDPTALPAEPGNYKLTSGVAVNDSWTLQTAGTYRLDLGDDIISSMANGSGVIIGDGCVLELYGSGGIILHGGGEDVIQVSRGGVFTQYGGMISKGVNTVHNMGTYTMHGGSVESANDSNEYGVLNEGTFYMDDGEIKDCNMTGVKNIGEATMTGGKISGNQRLGLVNEHNFTMTGGAISGNDSGVNNFGQFSLSGGGEISGNSDRGVINSGTGIFYMDGGKISNNTSPS